MKRYRNILKTKDQAQVRHPDVCIHYKGLFSQLGKAGPEVHGHRGLSCSTFSGSQRVDPDH